MRLANVANDPTWHAQAAIAVAALLQLVPSNDLVFSSKYLVAGLEIALLVLVSLPWLSAAAKRLIALVLVCIILISNITSLGLVIQQLLTNNTVNGRQLLLSGVAIYLVNIILFGLLYWELDGDKEDEPDFYFPQSGDAKFAGWRPSFFDYLYISITSGAAFSPTDTLPLTHRAKALMSLQAFVSLAIVVLVTARAVNVIN